MEPVEPHKFYDDFDDNQYLCPDLLADSSSDTSDDTISQSSFSLDYYPGSADRGALTVSPLSTLLVKPVLESQAMGSPNLCAFQPAWLEVTRGQDDEKWAHQDWLVDFVEVDEGG
ncbi:hypothetical protein MMC13_001009 [Lambiella insularis]|nr:hypothetical protein [Lambiella insularis]